MTMNHYIFMVLALYIKLYFCSIQLLVVHQLDETDNISFILFRCCFFLAFVKYLSSTLFNKNWRACIINVKRHRCTYRVSFSSSLVVCSFLLFMFFFFARCWTFETMLESACVNRWTAELNQSHTYIGIRHSSTATTTTATTTRRQNVKDKPTKQTYSQYCAQLLFRLRQRSNNSKQTKYLPMQQLQWLW